MMARLCVEKAAGRFRIAERPFASLALRNEPAPVLAVEEGAGWVMMALKWQMVL